VFGIVADAALEAVHDESQNAGVRACLGLILLAIVLLVSGQTRTRACSAPGPHHTRACPTLSHDPQGPPASALQAPDNATLDVKLQTVTVDPSQHTDTLGRPMSLATVTSHPSSQRTAPAHLRALPLLI
jgi:hypothetical protein